MTQATLYKVPAISCQHCVDSITTEVKKVAGVSAVTVDLNDKTVAVAGGDSADVIAAIDEAGYDVE